MSRFAPHVPIRPVWWYRILSIRHVEFLCDHVFCVLSLRLFSLALRLSLAVITSWGKSTPWLITKKKINHIFLIGKKIWKQRRMNKWRFQGQKNKKGDSNTSFIFRWKFNDNKKIQIQYFLIFDYAVKLHFYYILSYCKHAWFCQFFLVFIW